MNENSNLDMLLTEDEKGQLHGGFLLQGDALGTRFFSTNINCKGGGWCDSNANCNRCSQCDHLKDPSIPPDKPIGPVEDD